jgi:hypothetical protein
MPALIRPKNAVTVSIIANVLSVPCRPLARCHAAQSKGFYAITESREELMIYSNKIMQPSAQLDSWAWDRAPLRQRDMSQIDFDWHWRDYKIGETPCRGSREVNARN